jgi:hypothetical protein
MSFIALTIPYISSIDYLEALPISVHDLGCGETWSHDSCIL